MSERVYLSKNAYRTTRWEDTPMSSRMQLSHATVKTLHSRLRYAYRHDDVRVVRRTTVFIDLLMHRVPIAVLS